MINLNTLKKVIAVTERYPKKPELSLDKSPLLCPFSLKPMTDAVIMDTCGHSISKESESQLKKKICPKDGKEYSKVTPNFQLRNLISDALPNYTYKDQRYQIELPKNLILPHSIDIPEKKEFDINSLNVDNLTALIEMYPFVLELRFRRAILYTENKDLNNSLMDLNICTIHSDTNHKQHIKYAIHRAFILNRLELYELSKNFLEKISKLKQFDHLEIELKVIFYFTKLLTQFFLQDNLSLYKTIQILDRLGHRKIPPAIFKIAILSHAN